MNNTRHFEQFVEKMRKENLPQVVIDTFHHYYQKLLEGQTGCLREEEIDNIPRGDIPHYQELLSFQERGKKALTQTAVIKVNGGLGTSMGLSKAKSLQKVKGKLTFLDIVARQLRTLNDQQQQQVPLVLMNSFNTHQDTVKAMEPYQGTLPIEYFLQHKFPKVRQDDLQPASCPENPELEWNPPGHGDIYTALVTSGLLEKLLEKGIRYAFISNIDNLCAHLDMAILGYFAENDLPFLMEATKRTEMDKKGGHLARLSSGQLVLRESAQCAQEDQNSFQDVAKHAYFNTNNIWVNLVRLKEVLEKQNYVLGLPMIRNEKRLRPNDESTPKVYQLETAMGSAISVFSRARAIEVTRSRFAPVKKCNELLLLWSDYFILTEDYQIVRNPEHPHEQIMVSLDPQFFQEVEHFSERFAHVPSLVHCRFLEVEGDVFFGPNVKIEGGVRIKNSSENRVYLEDKHLKDQELIF